MQMKLLKNILKKPMAKSKTAVEFLYEGLMKGLSHEQQMQFEGLFQQALDMEYKQMLDMWQAALWSDIKGGKNFDMYYYAKYKQEEE